MHWGGLCKITCDVFVEQYPIENMSLCWVTSNYVKIFGKKMRGEESEEESPERLNKVRKEQVWSGGNDSIHEENEAINWSARVDRREEYINLTGWYSMKNEEAIGYLMLSDISDIVKIDMVDLILFIV